jgi:hypothetical protein
VRFISLRSTALCHKQESSDHLVLRPESLVLESRNPSNPSKDLDCSSLVVFRLINVPTAPAIQNIGSAARPVAKAEDIGRKIRIAIAVPTIAGSAIKPTVAVTAFTPTGAHLRNSVPMRKRAAASNWLAENADEEI